MTTDQLKENIKKGKLSGVYLFGLLMLTRFVQLKIWQKDSAVG